MEPWKTTVSLIYPSEGRLTLNEYQTLSQRTAKPLGEQQKFWHGAQGIASDGGEVLTISKANQFYGKPVDTKHALEELGDCLWFLQEAAAGLGFTLESVALYNLDKLRKRYPDRYSDELAIARLDKQHLPKE